MNHSHHYTFFRDEDYLREIKAGGPGAESAISSLYKKYRKRTFASMVRLTSRQPFYRGAPDDHVHDAFIIMIHKIQFESPKVRSLCSFWIGISKKLYLNQLKKDERYVLVREDEEEYGLNEDSPETLLLQKEEIEQMAYTFSQLGSRCREILMLWYNQHTMVEIAQRLHLSNDAMARKIKFGCFKKLKELIRKGNTKPV